MGKALSSNPLIATFRASLADFIEQAKQQVENTLIVTGKTGEERMRRESTNLVFSIFVALSSVFFIRSVQARWLASANGMSFNAESVCGDGIRFGLAGASSGPYEVVAKANESVVATDTVSLPHNPIGVPGYEGLRDYSGFFSLYWSQPLSVAQDITLEITLGGVSAEIEIAADDCAITGLPSLSIYHVCSAGVPGPIRDTVTSTLQFPAHVRIVDVDAQMYVTHTWTADLEATLTSPVGTAVTLFRDVGQSGDDFGTRCQDNPDFYLDDEGDTTLSSGIAPFTAGVYIPQSPLSGFDGEGAWGNWTLGLVDTFPSEDDGKLQCWCLNVTGIDQYVQITDITIDGNSNYVVEFETYNFEPDLSGPHLRFFFGTEFPEKTGETDSEAGLPYGGTSPFTGYAKADRPQLARQMCVLVTNADDSIRLHTGDCFTLPDQAYLDFLPLFSHNTE